MSRTALTAALVLLGASPVLAGAPPRIARATGALRAARTPAVSSPATPDVASDRAPFWEWGQATGRWFGLRDRLEERGVGVAATLLWNTTGVARGGVHRKTSTRGLADLNLALDLERLLGWPGATLFADAYATFGHGGSEDVGDFQAFDNIESPERTQLAELWWEQRLAEDRLRVKLGKIDANSEFAFVANGGGFLSSSAGVSPTLLALPTYPDPATGALAFAYPWPWIYAGAGLFDGSLQDGVETGRRGPRSLFRRDPEGSKLAIAETGLVWEQALLGGPGRAAIGGWLHTAEFERFDGGREDGTGGFYAVVEQRLLATRASLDDPARGISAFGQIGLADPKLSEVEKHLAVGLVWDAPIARRPGDTLGFYVGFADLSDAAGAGFSGNETAYELFYALRVTPFLTITTDVQWIDEPSRDASLRDALVTGVRFEVSL